MLGFQTKVLVVTSMSGDYFRLIPPDCMVSEACVFRQCWIFFFANEDRFTENLSIVGVVVCKLCGLRQNGSRWILSSTGKEDLCSRRVSPLSLSYVTLTARSTEILKRYQFFTSVRSFISYEIRIFVRTFYNKISIPDSRRQSSRKITRNCISPRINKRDDRSQWNSRFMNFR